MKIPVMRMCEHNEVYYYWHQMTKLGYIPEKGNYLLHVDHHDDMESGGYAWDFNHRPTSEPEVRKFTYDVLGIADFIIPAVYYRLFSDVHILKNVMPVKMTSSIEFVRCVEKCELQRGKMIPFLHGKYMNEENCEYRFFNLYEGSMFENDTFVNAIKDKSVVLDVDLDYFCWDDILSTTEPKRIEITKEAYEDYMNNLYHPYRILPKRGIFVVENEGKYYLEYKEYGHHYPIPTKERMEKRMDKLLAWFKECNLCPAAIDICSSHYSGYLPKDVYPWIEERFLEKLSEVWELEILN